MKYLIAVLLVLVVWLFQNQAAFVLNEFLLWPKQWLVGDQKQLELENEALKAELFKLKQETKTAPDNFLVAKIYARYPFNDKSFFSVNIGADGGVQAGMVATANGSLLVGKIDKIFTNYSLVKTIFSPNWQIPIRIGENGFEGLFNGGANPYVTMIAKDRKIKEGDIIFVADSDFPYGLKIGEVGEVILGTDADAFQSVTVILPYKSSDLKELWLTK